MSDWKRHELAGDEREQLLLDANDRCVAAVDLPGVPAGTPGRVAVANGFSWRRYRVRFENGVELAHLDARHIAPAPRRGRFGR